MKIGSYLPSAVLVSTAMLFSGLGEWSRARWVQVEEISEKTKATQDDQLGVIHEVTARRWVSRRRPVLGALLLMVATHLMGVVLFCVTTQGWAHSGGRVSHPLYK